MSVDGYLRRADDLLDEAAKATDLKDRRRLLDEAIRMHNLALEARDHPRIAPANDTSERGAQDGR